MRPPLKSITLAEHMAYVIHCRVQKLNVSHKYSCFMVKSMYTKMIRDDVIFAVNKIELYSLS